MESLIERDSPQQVEPLLQGNAGANGVTSVADATEKLSMSTGSSCEKEQTLTKNKQVELLLRELPSMLVSTPTHTLQVLDIYLIAFAVVRAVLYTVLAMAVLLLLLLLLLLLMNSSVGSPAWLKNSMLPPISIGSLMPLPPPALPPPLEGGPVR
uniref:Uncharacterized protein n=1 Tax=Anopheles atroparvus TaxID=41427 RepID=A0A182J9Q2_ANOAO